MSAFGAYYNGSIRETIISFGVAAWPNLTMVGVVLAPFCLGVD